MPSGVSPHIFHTPQISQVAANAGYVLSHPKFGAYLREDYFDRATIALVQQCFGEWGRKQLRQVNLETSKGAGTPEYLLQYLGQHFDDIGASPSDYMQFVEEGWLRACFSFEGDYRGFSRDVLRAAQAVTRLKTGSLLFRCGMMLSSVRSVGFLMNPILVVKCVKRGVLPLKSALQLAKNAYPAAERSKDQLSQDF